MTRSARRHLFWAVIHFGQRQTLHYEGTSFHTECDTSYCIIFKIFKESVTNINVNSIVFISSVLHKSHSATQKGAMAFLVLKYLAALSKSDGQRQFNPAIKAPSARPARLYALPTCAACGTGLPRPTTFGRRLSIAARANSMSSSASPASLAPIVTISHSLIVL